MIDLYSTQDVCKLSNVSKHTACRWARGRVRKLSQEYLWSQEDLDAFKERNKQVGRPKKDGGEDYGTIQ